VVAQCGIARGTEIVNCSCNFGRSHVSFLREHRVQRRSRSVQLRIAEHGVGRGREIVNFLHAVYGGAMPNFCAERVRKEEKWRRKSWGSNTESSRRESWGSRVWRAQFNDSSGRSSTSRARAVQRVERAPFNERRLRDLAETGAGGTTSA
jgi:hypothetical protein